MDKKLGFTLAEVLVVISLLGVIAAISVPTMIQNTQQREFITKYRKTFAALDKAFSQYQIENGIYVLDPPNTGNWRGGGGLTPIFNEFFSRYFVVTNNGWQSDSINYYDFDENKDKEDKKFYNVDSFKSYNKGKGIKLLNGNTPNRKLKRSWKITFSDGAEMSLNVGHTHWVRKNNNTTNFYNGSYFLDVNGEEKGPNIIGKDIYLGYILFDGFHPLPLSDEFTQNCSDCFPFHAQNIHNNEPCNKNSSGVSCSRWFINHNGWER